MLTRSQQLGLLILLVIFILKLLTEIILQMLKLKSLASEPIDCPRNKLLLNILSELVVKL